MLLWSCDCSTCSAWCCTAVATVPYRLGRQGRSHARRCAQHTMRIRTAGCEVSAPGLPWRGARPAATRERPQETAAEGSHTAPRTPPGSAKDSELFEAGLPYWHLSETINSVSAKRPAVRRQLQGAWDVAFAWMALEPRTHHVAMPAAVVLLTVLAVSLVWGWRQEAGLFGLAWGALLRIGEATGALREALVLPRDVLYTQAFALLKIEEPKTRFRVARHQAAKLEASDLVALVDMAFGKLPKGSKLWPFSAQTLRRRLDAILEALWIPTSRTSRRPLDLGSFRPGGATYLLQATEDSELVRRGDAGCPIRSWRFTSKKLLHQLTTQASPKQPRERLWMQPPPSLCFWTRPLGGHRATFPLGRGIISGACKRYRSHW